MKTVTDTHRPREVFESGGQTVVKTMAVLGVGIYRKGSPPPTTGVGGFTPEIFWKFYVQNWEFGGKIALCFDYKQTVILTQTFGHKSFSEVE